MARAVCVYCSSSDSVGEHFFSAARELGRQIGLRGHSLVYGGGGVGLMGALAEAASAAGARVTGVLPEALVSKGITGARIDQLVITRDMRDRKAAMQERSDAFIALPGGFGTLEELLEMLTLRQLGYHEKPVALVNVDGFFDPLLAQFERMYELSFAKPAYRALFCVTVGAVEALAYVETYVPEPLPAKWTRA